MSQGEAKAARVSLAQAAKQEDLDEKVRGRSTRSQLNEGEEERSDCIICCDQALVDWVEDAEETFWLLPIVR